MALRESNKRDKSTNMLDYTELCDNLSRQNKLNVYTVKVG